MVDKDKVKSEIKKVQVTGGATTPKLLKKGANVPQKPKPKPQK